jgi:type II secretory pathway component GspD/PulD (secretin)
MRNTLKFLVAGALVSGVACAQEKSESVDSILKELGGYQGKTSPAAPAPAPAVKAAPAAPVAEAPAPAVVAAPAEVSVPAIAEAPEKAKSSKGWKFWKKDAPEAVAVTEQSAAPAVADTPAEKPAKDEIPAPVVAALDVPATLEASRELYAGGEFEQAQKGFEAVIKKDPENIVARMYLRKILERDPRTAEIKGMKGVTEGWKTGIVLRSYDISAEAAVKMGVEKIAEPADMTGKFPEVDFPKGASAVYQPKSGKLFVRNTRDNLLVLEEILSSMDAAKTSSGVDQVEIEAKFVEVSEGTLEALGFNWNFSSSAVHTGIEGNDVTANDGDGLFANALRGTSQSPAIPFSQAGTLDNAGFSQPAGSSEWKAFRFEDTFNNTPASMTLRNNGSKPLDVIISALDQTAGTDVLSAPRITTKSGEKASIRVGNIHYFPEVYQVGGNEGTIVHVKYSDFSEKLLGVELDVNPKIDGDQIALSLNPKVSELLGWQNYQIAPANSAYSYYQLGINQQFNHDPIVARLPVFNRREIKTEVTIADGATMGMGGLINEKVEKYEDKVPVLGSIPLVGRLFRSEGERAVKRNLMIFVTAKKVEPSGRISTSRSFE